MARLLSACQVSMYKRLKHSLTGLNRLPCTHASIIGEARGVLFCFPEREGRHRGGFGELGLLFRSRHTTGCLRFLLPSLAASPFPAGSPSATTCVCLVLVSPPFPSFHSHLSTFFNRCSNQRSNAASQVNLHRMSFEVANLHRCLSTQRRISRRNSMSNNYDGRDDRGWTPLHIAARKGDIDEVRRLLNDGADVNQISSGHKDSGATALHLAAAGGHIDVMDELLERGCNIDARTRVGCGWTPLHHAAKERNKKAIRFLIENGAFLPPDILDERFNPPLHYCGALEWAYKVKKRSREREFSSEKSSEEEGSVSL